MGDHVSLVSSAEETAKDVLRILSQQDLLADPDMHPEPSYSFESTGDPEIFAQLSRRFLGPIVSQVRQNEG